MAATRVAWFSIVVGLLFLIPAVPSADTPTDTAPAVVPDAGSAVVRILVPGAEAASLGSGVQVVERYDQFVLARATEDAVARLSDRGVTVVPEDTYSLHVNGYVFDTREPIRVPAALEAPGVAEGRVYSLLQFVGPVKEEWKSAVEATGAEIVAYVPNNGFVVGATAEQLARIRAIPEVQWMGAHHPAFRISPDLLAAEGLVVVKIITFGGEPVGPAVAMLNKLGYRVIGRWADGPGILSFAEYSDFGLVRARIDPSELVPLARLRATRYIEPQEEMQLANRNVQFVLQTNSTTDPGTRKIWDQGINGELQTIALSDTGLDYDHSSFRQDATTVTIGDIYNVTNVNRRKVIRYLPMSGFVGVDPFTGGDPNAIKDSPDGFCGSGHGTATSGAAGGNDDPIASSPNEGMARASRLVMIDIGSVDATACDDSLRYLPDDYGDMFGAAYASPTNARIFSNSWGGSSFAYTLEASRTDRFIWNNPDALILFANGNNPPNARVGSPATAKNVVSVGGAQSWNNRDAISGVSFGPTADGRRKPDISTIYGGGSTALSDGDLTSLNTGDWFGSFGGTSYATPLAAGMAALLRQYYFQGWYPRGVVSGDPAIIASAALLKATLAASSVQMTAASACPATDAFYPNNAQGWGRLWLDEALYFSGASGESKRLYAVDHRSGIYTGDTLEYKVRVNSANGRFRAMLAWSDAPGIEGASPALVNNLDLEIIDPVGTTYRGNVRGTCAQGQSQSGGSFDVLNNLEGVYRRVPAVGEWRIRVIGANVAMGPQRFGLVVLADLDPAYGTLEIDRTVYNEADTIQITVTDGDASSPLSVSVTSSTEISGETASLARIVAPGGFVFRGTIQTNYGVPAADGRIQVSCGDIVTATYNDGSPPHASTARARIECDPPAISNVRVIGVTNSAATILWDTDKPSDSTVYYGTTTALGSTRTDSTQTVSHSITLTGLLSNTPYFFDVASSRVGRQARDSNGGDHYRFKTTGGAEILLVISDNSFTTTRLDMYRDALAGASWSWNEWEVDRQGDPTLAVLRSYKVVIWQAGLEQYPPMQDAHATLIKQFVDTGGRVMFSGHDYAWAACDPGSAYGTPARCNFVRSVMKGNFVADPQTFSQQIGRVTDVISDGYQVGGAIGPQSYSPHRDGGAADEVNTINAGGTTTNVWATNSGGSPPWDGIKWISSANNGTCPGGIWCNTPSRVASYFFEFTGINNGVASDPRRTDILNRTIVFLLGRNPPVVRVTSPNGGENIVASPLSVTWERSQPLSSQEIWYSADSGASWTLAKTVAAAASSDSLDISTWRNGCGYLIRVVVLDTGTPQFSAQDSSDGTFCIARPGADNEGPLVRPGSLRLSPNPARNGQPVTFNATVDDTLRGNSNIAAAEAFVQATEPTPADFGGPSAIPMSAVGGPFDNVWENVQASVTATWPEGSTQILWVHGQDVAGNWGGFWTGNRSFLVIAGTVVPPPSPPTNAQAELTAAGFTTVHLTWAYSGPAVDKFQVYFGTTYDATGATYALLQDNIGSAQFQYDHVGAGSGDTSSYFYYVRAVNAGGTANSLTQAAKFTRSLSGGRNLISVPVVPVDTRIETALQTMSWRTARTFVASDPADPWKAAYFGRTADLRTVTLGMALWVDLASADDFTIAGQVPASTTINLVAGWNFVGYGSFNARIASVAFTGVPVTRLEGYSATPQYYLQALPMTTTLSAGQGYWVYTTAAAAWTVTN